MSYDILDFSWEKLVASESHLAVQQPSELNPPHYKKNIWDGDSLHQIIIFKYFFYEPTAGGGTHQVK